MRIGARPRLEMFLDEDGRQEIGADVVPVDRLKFKDSKSIKTVLRLRRKKPVRKMRWLLCAVK